MIDTPPSAMPEYKIDIRNFQSIENAELTFQGFTVIRGESDIGKSAVRRALGAVLYNDWSADYITIGKSETKITLETPTFATVMTKSKKSNSFEVTTENGLNVYNKIGTEYPSEHREAGFDYFYSGRDYYNLTLSSQLEPLFMVSYRDLEVTAILNKMFQIDKIERALKLVNLDMRRLNQEIQICETDIESKEKQVKDFTAKIEDLNTNIIKRLETLTKKVQLIEDFIKTKTSAVQQSKRVKHYRELLPKLDKLVLILQNRLAYLKYQEAQEQLEQIKTIYQLFDRVPTSLDKLKTLEAYITSKDKHQRQILKLQKLTAIDSHYTEVPLITGKLKQIAEYQTILEQYQDKKAKITSLTKVLKNFQGIPELTKKLNLLIQYDNSLCQYYEADENLAQAQNRCIDVAKELAEYTICPLCGAEHKEGIHK